MANESFFSEYPYESYAFKETHPTHLFTLGQLFGLQPKPVENAKVLELGCARGGNLIPMAFHWPTTEFLGIDLLETQVQAGMKQINDLGLHNINIRHQSILDFKDTKSYDYIICHGVYSWVDTFTRNKILEICHHHLAEHGIAYVSYNTLPGWISGKALRDLFHWQIPANDEPFNKAKKARSILSLLDAGLADNTSAYAQMVRNEIKLISHHSDTHLIHEHLACENHAFYFHQFMQQAQNYKLTFLCEAFLSTMYTGDLSPLFVKELQHYENRIAQGQYLDFIQNRRFRSTLLCHLKQQNNILICPKQFEQTLLSINSSACEYSRVISQFPIACQLARYQAQYQEIVTNPSHENIHLTPIMQIILPYLDGTNDIDALVKMVQYYIDENILIILDKQNQPIMGEDLIMQHIQNNIFNSLENLAKRGLLTH